MPRRNKCDFALLHPLETPFSSYSYPFYKYLDILIIFQSSKKLCGVLIHASKSTHLNKARYLSAFIGSPRLHQES